MDKGAARSDPTDKSSHTHHWGVSFASRHVVPKPIPCKRHVARRGDGGSAPQAALVLALRDAATVAPPRRPPRRPPSRLHCMAWRRSLRPASTRSRAPLSRQHATLLRRRPSPLAMSCEARGRAGTGLLALAAFASSTNVMQRDQRRGRRPSCSRFSYRRTLRRQ